MTTQEIIKRYGIHPHRLLTSGMAEHREVWDSLPAEDRVEHSVQAIMAGLGHINSADGHSGFPFTDRTNFMRALDKLIDAKIEVALATSACQP